MPQTILAGPLTADELAASAVMADDVIERIAVVDAARAAGHNGTLLICTKHNVIAPLNDHCLIHLPGTERRAAEKAVDADDFPDAHSVRDLRPATAEEIDAWNARAKAFWSKQDRQAAQQRAWQRRPARGL